MNTKATLESVAEDVEEHVSELSQRAETKARKLAGKAATKGAEVLDEASQHLSHAGEVVRAHPFASSGVAVAVIALAAAGGYLLARCRR